MFDRAAKHKILSLGAVFAVCMILLAVIEIYNL